MYGSSATQRLNSAVLQIFRQVILFLRWKSTDNAHAFLFAVSSGRTLITTLSCSKMFEQPRDKMQLFAVLKRFIAHVPLTVYCLKWRSIWLFDPKLIFSRSEDGFYIKDSSLKGVSGLCLDTIGLMKRPWSQTNCPYVSRIGDSMARTHWRMFLRETPYP